MASCIESKPFISISRVIILVVSDVPFEAAPPRPTGRAIYKISKAMLLVKIKNNKKFEGKT